MARDFDGSNDAISFSDITGFTTYTICFWIKNQASLTNSSFLGCDNFSATPRESSILKFRTVNTGRFESHIDGTGGTNDDAWTANENIWRHIVISRNGTTITDYRDNSSLGTITVGSGTADLLNIRLGCHYFSGSNQEFGNCVIGEFCIWTTNLGANQLGALFRGVNSFPLEPDVLFASLYGNDSPEGDLSGNARIGTLVDAPSKAPHPQLEHIENYL